MSLEKCEFDVVYGENTFGQLKIALQTSTRTRELQGSEYWIFGDGDGDGRKLAARLTIDDLPAGAVSISVRGMSYNAETARTLVGGETNALNATSDEPTDRPVFRRLYE